MNKELLEKLNLVPEKPGSYQMKNSDGVIIYVGKAKNLKKRLKSYFTGLVTGKTLKLVKEIATFEYIITSTELESLILEITLIKKYNPKYNIDLKDDKSYPYIELTNETYPKLKIVRNINRKKNKSSIFGPYPNAYAARKTVNMLNRLYPLRKCEKLKKETCLYYHIGECLGYCSNTTSNNDVTKMVAEITSFLKGNSDTIIKRLKTEMNTASEVLNYEKALELKEMLDDIEITLIKQKLDLNKRYNLDIFGFYQDNNYLSIVTFYIREGLLFGTNSDIFNIAGQPEDELVNYIVRFYEKNNIIPKEIIVPKEIDKDLLASYFNIKVSSPTKGDLKKLSMLASVNAKEYLNEKIEKISGDEDSRLEALEELKQLLNLEKLSRIEAFDNSHLFGSFYVGAMVVFDDFLPNKNEYRKYKIASNVNDDLSAMKEVIYRRYFKVLMAEVPKCDLILVDGGPLQVKTAREVLNSLNLNIPLCGLKKDIKHKTSSLINQDLQEININKNSKLFIFLNKIGEEVHRFAISYHRDIKSKGTLSSLLDMAPGIGEVRRKELLKRFGSLKKLKEASIEELEEILSKDVAKKLFDFLREI